MKYLFESLAALALLPLVTHADVRLRTERYDPNRVTTLVAKVGVTTHIVLSEDEQIEFVSTGVGADCAKASDTWCIVAPLHGHQLFIKPKAAATGSNNIAIATNNRSYSLRFEVVSAVDSREPAFRLSYEYEEVLKHREKESEAIRELQASMVSQPMPVIAPGPSTADIVRERIKASPAVMNADYSVSIGKHSDDIAPTMIFDDGRFTYFKYPNNREVPAIFVVADDGHESVVNARMEVDPVSGRRDLLCADVVGKRFYLRRGPAVVGVFNESFDLDGTPPIGGTTIAGVKRVLKGTEQTDGN